MTYKSDSPVGFSENQLADWIISRRPDMSYRTALEHAEDIMERISQLEDSVHQSDLDHEQMKSPWKTSSESISKSIEDLLRYVQRLVRANDVLEMSDNAGELDLPHNSMRSYWRSVYALFVELFEANDPYDQTFIYLTFPGDAIGLFILSSCGEVYERVVDLYGVIQEQEEDIEQNIFEDEEGDE